MKVRGHYRGLTLLELLISMTILASITAGIGLFWSQAKSWEDDNAEHREVLRVERVLRLMREQWGGKRDVADPDDGDAGGSGVVVTEDGVLFTTSRPVLFPGWGLVRVRYGIERWIDGGYALVYEEARVMDAGELPVPGTDALDPRGRPVGAREVLLSGLSELRFERWGTLDGRALVSLNDSAEPVLGDRDDEDEGLDLATREDLEARWRLFDRELESSPRAVRLIGAMGEEVFSCVLVVGALR